MENSIIMIVAVASFVISSVIGKFLIPVLHKIKFGQPIRDEGPQWHQKKSGTPTMGGIMFIVGAVCVSIIGYVVLCILNPGSRDFIDHLKFYSGIVMALLFGVIGFVDDYIKVVKKHNQGLTEKQKLVLQFLVAIAYVLTLYLGGCGSVTFIPFIGPVDLGIFYWVVSVVFIVGFVNATNLTDGLDGLDGSVTFFASLVLMVIAGFVLDTGASVMSSALAGACLGFFKRIYNVIGSYCRAVRKNDTAFELNSHECAAVGIAAYEYRLRCKILVNVYKSVIQESYKRAVDGADVFKRVKRVIMRYR